MIREPILVLNTLGGNDQPVILGGGLAIRRHQQKRPVLITDQTTGFFLNKTSLVAGIWR